MIETRAIEDRETWLEWRRQDVTASQVGALFHCHPYSTELRIWAEKRGTEFVDGDNTAMRRGRWLEPAVAKAVEETRPDWKLEGARHYLRDPELRIGCTPDFYVHGDPRGRGVCQSKTVAPHVFARDWAGGDEVPLWIILQAQTEAMLAQADFVVIAALLVDARAMDVWIHELPRHPGAEAKIRATVAKFWDKVDKSIEPDPDFARDADVIRAMWRSEEPTNIVDFGGNNRIPEILAERCALKDAIKGAQDRLDAIDAEIKWAMKDAALATNVPGFRVTFTTTNFKEYTVAARSNRVLRVTDRREIAP